MNIKDAVVLIPAFLLCLITQAHAIDSTQAFDLQSIDTSVECPVRAHMADVNGDGKLDILVAAWCDNKIFWYDAANGWTRHEITSNFSGACSVWGYDMDGDDDIDIVAAAMFSSEIAWWEN